MGRRPTKNASVPKVDFFAIVLSNGTRGQESGTPGNDTVYRHVYARLGVNSYGEAAFDETGRYDNASVPLFQALADYLAPDLATPTG